MRENKNLSEIEAINLEFTNQLRIVGNAMFYNFYAGRFPRLRTIGNFNNRRFLEEKARHFAVCDAICNTQATCGSDCANCRTCRSRFGEEFAVCEVCEAEAR